MEKYWNEAISFDEYIKETENRIQANDEKLHYYELGMQRMNRALKTFKISDEQVENFKAKGFNGKIFIISEPWCGDASAIVPVVSKFFETNGIEVKIFLRDNDPALINQFLTNGTQAIPKILFLDSQLNVQKVWGPRPKYGMELLKKFKENPTEYPREAFYNDLQVYYAKNRGADTINEILELL
ncbi:MAG: thioredoxin family protein [Bergeyella zoohelcum]|nr:thioredoxin family protein [Bergeyella zoohelcum]